tara:strand:- start:5657 stop:5863 length:207 start_codon:yes stop_codon:yes gene_type:complete
MSEDQSCDVILYQIEDHKCNFEPYPDYTDDKAFEMSDYEVRDKWPRKICKVCGTIWYQTAGHFVAGDY